MSENEKENILSRSTLFNNWVTVATALILTGALLVGWAHGLLDFPDRITRLEEAQKPLTGLPVQVESMKVRLDAVESDNLRKTELLIRMDERLKSIQDRLSIPHESIK